MGKERVITASAHTKYRLGDLVSFVSGGTPSKQVPAYWGGRTPWVSAKDLKSLRVSSSIDSLSEDGRKVAWLVPPGTLLILVRGMSLFKNIPLGVTTRELAINQDLKGLIPTGKASAEYLAYSLLAREDMLLRMVEAAGHGTGRLDTDTLKDFLICVPSREEQELIVRALATWDASIEKTERLIALENQRLIYLRDHHIRQGPNFERIKLQSITRESTARNGKRLGRETIMAVTKQAGMRPMREQTIAASIERYKVVRPKAFAYNPMRLNIGSIAMSSFETDVLVSPDYVVFECNETRLLPSYLNHLRYSRRWLNYFEAAGNGSVRVRIYYNDLAAFTVDLPPLDGQRQIAELLDTATLRIEKLSQYVETLRRQKTGLMQKLLTGQWRLKDVEAEAA